MKSNTFLFLLFMTHLNFFGQTIIKTYHDIHRTKLKEVIEVKPNTPIVNGSYKLYDDYGFLTLSSNYVNNIKNGIETTYFGAYQSSLLPDNLAKIHLGKVSGTYNYLNGELHGKQTTYKYNTKGERRIEFEKNYTNGVIISTTIYYENGNIDTKIQRNGSCATYYENGNKKEEYSNKDNEYEGSYIYYHKNGNKLITGDFQKGVKKGTWYEYFKDGRLKTKSVYENGLLVDELSNFDNGKLKYEIKRINETVFVESLFDSISNKTLITQEFLLVGALRKQHGIKKYFFANGNIELIETYENDKFTGVSTKYFENGNIEEIYEKTKNNDLLRYIKFNQENIKIHEMTINANSDKKNGLCKIYNPNGTIKEIGEYFNDQKIKEWKYYDSTGNLEFIEIELNGNRIKKDLNTIKNEEIKEYIATNRPLFEDNIDLIEKLYTVEDKIATKIFGEITYKKEKKHLYNAYELYLNNIKNRINSSNQEDSKTALSEGLKLTEKIIALARRDTDDIEKKLKKEKDIENIKSILELK